MLKNYPLVALPLRNGVIGALLGMALFISLFYFGRHPFFLPVVIDFRILLFAVLIYFTLKEYRDYYRQGQLSFWEGMIMSLELTIAFALVAYLTILIFGSLIQPEFVSGYVRLKMAQLSLYPAEDIKRIGKAQYDLFVNQLPFTTASDLAGIYFRQSFVLSFFISVILSVILRRQPKLQ